MTTLTLALPRLVRATLTRTTLTRTTLTRTGLAAAVPPRVPPPRVPVRGPVRVPAPRGPVDHTPAPALRFPVDPDPVASCGPQAAGDVIVLPWPDFLSPHVRHLHTSSAAPVPRAGLTVHHPHVLVGEGGTVFWSPWPDQGGPTLGTLVVPAGVVARLVHDEHAAVRVGPGVYAVRRQRRAEPWSAPVLVED